MSWLLPGYSCKSMILQGNYLTFLSFHPQMGSTKGFNDAISWSTRAPDREPSTGCGRMHCHLVHAWDGPKTVPSLSLFVLVLLRCCVTQSYSG